VKPVCETRAAGAGARIWEPVKEPVRESPAMLRRPAIFVWCYASAWVAVDGVRDVTGFRLRIKQRGKALVGFGCADEAHGGGKRKEGVSLGQRGRSRIAFIDERFTGFIDAR